MLRTETFRGRNWERVDTKVNNYLESSGLRPKDLYSISHTIHLFHVATTITFEDSPRSKEARAFIKKYDKRGQLEKLRITYEDYLDTVEYLDARCSNCFHMYTHEDLLNMLKLWGYRPEHELSAIVSVWMAYKRAS